MWNKLSLLGITLFLLIGCGKEDLKPKFAGDWLRHDGTYSLVIEVSPDGDPKVKYFNPRSINIKAALFKVEGVKTQIHIVFDDINYEGSYYLLSYNPEKDILEGKYFQVSEQQFYLVSFNRQN